MLNKSSLMSFTDKVLSPRPSQVLTANVVHSVALLKVVLGDVTVDFLLKVSSIEKLGVPPSKTPIISIKAPLLNNPIGSLPLKVISATAVDKFGVAINVH